MIVTITFSILTCRKCAFLLDRNTISEHIYENRPITGLSLTALDVGVLKAKHKAAIKSLPQCA